MELQAKEGEVQTCGIPEVFVQKRCTFLLSHFLSPYPFKGKSKVVPLNTIKTYRRSEIIATPIRNFGIRWKRVVNLIPQPPRKETLVPIHRGADGPKSRSGHFGEEKNSLPD